MASLDQIVTLLLRNALVESQGSLDQSSFHTSDMQIFFSSPRLEMAYIYKQEWINGLDTPLLSIYR